MERLISAAHRAANCPPAGLRVRTALMKQEMHRRGLEWKHSAMRAVHTCAYRLNIAWWESSWNVKWRGREEKWRKKGGGERSKAEKQCRGVGKGGGEGKKQVWSGKLVQLSGQKRHGGDPPKNHRVPGNRSEETWKEQAWKQRRFWLDNFTFFRLSTWEIKATKKRKEIKAQSNQGEGCQISAKTVETSEWLDHFVEPPDNCMARSVR